MKGFLINIARIILLCIALAAQSAAAQDALLLDVDGALGPAAVNYIATGLKQAALEQDTLVILRLNSAGGFATSIRQINNLILNSTVPIVTYVAPGGAKAANAAIIVVYASPLAAMSPNSTLGTPTVLTSGPNVDELKDIKQSNLTPLEAKKINLASQYVAELAKLHNRNSAWAEDAVRNGANISAQQALAQKVIDVIASTPADLLQKINGLHALVSSVSVVLETKNLTIKILEPNWRNKLLATITSPNVAYLLLLIGVYALFLEFFHPGIFLPGAIGILLIVVAVYAFTLLPVNMAGFALLVLGITFMIIELQVSSFGIMGLGGIIAFMTGSILLLNVNSPGYQISWSLIFTMTTVSALFFLGMVTLSVRRRNQTTDSGLATLIGAQGVVEEIFNSREILVKANGKLWKATSQTPVKKGQPIRIYGSIKSILKVEPLHTQQLEKP